MRASVGWVFNSFMNALALELEHVVLAQKVDRVRLAARQHVGEAGGDGHVVLGRDARGGGSRRRRPPCRRGPPHPAG